MSKAILTWHPTFAYFHNPYEYGAFDIDLERFARAIHNQLHGKPRVLSIKPKVRHLKQLLRETPGVISVDIETGPEASHMPWTGKDPTRAKLRTIGLGNHIHGVSHWWTNGRKRVEREIKRILEDPNIVKVFHNGDWFDLRVLQRYGIRVRNVFDTRDARRALSSTSPLKLSYLASLYLDAHPWKENEEDDEKGLVFTKSKRKLKIYNSFDCSYTHGSYTGITSEPEWNTPRVQRLYEVHRELARIAAEMHTNGIRVDMKRRQELYEQMGREFEEKKEKLNKMCGIDLNVNPNKMRALIFKRHAVGKYAKYGRFNLPDPLDPAMYTNAKDMDSACKVDYDALTSLLIDPDTPGELKEIIELYWDASSIRKARSTFIKSERLDQRIGRDGYMRADWNSCGTDTGRFSGFLMIVPKKYRQIYTASKGNELVGADWSQLELRVRVVVMDDHVLAEDLASGDVYGANARVWFGLPEHLTKCTCTAVDKEGKHLCLKPDQHIKKEARDSCKQIHLASQYWAGTKTVWRTALRNSETSEERNRFTWSLVSGLHNSFKRRYYRTVQYWEENHKLVNQRGYSESLILQRRRYYPREAPTTETANYDTQATAADIKNLCLIEIDRKLKKYIPGAKLVMDLHDAIYADVPKRRVKDTIEIMREVMEQPFTIKGRQWIFPTEIEHGFRLNEA